MSVVASSSCTQIGENLYAGIVRATGDGTGGTISLTLSLPERPGAVFETLAMAVEGLAGESPIHNAYAQFQVSPGVLAGIPTSVPLTPNKNPTAQDLAGLIDAFRYLVHLGEVGPWLFGYHSNTTGQLYSLAWRGRVVGNLSAWQGPQDAPRGAMRSMRGGLLLE